MTARKNKRSKVVLLELGFARPLAEQWVTKYVLDILVHQVTIVFIKVSAQTGRLVSWRVNLLGFFLLVKDCHQLQIHLLAGHRVEHLGLHAVESVGALFVLLAHELIYLIINHQVQGALKEAY